MSSSADPFVIEADQQSDTTTSSRASFGVCLKAIVTVVDSKAAMEAQKRQQVEPLVCCAYVTTSCG